MNVTAIVIFIAVALMLLAFTVMRRRNTKVFRTIEAYEKLRKAVGNAVEGGTRLHISIGRGNLFTARGGSALAGLALLRRLTEITSVSDQPPIVSSGDPSLTILTQDTLQSGYRAAGAEDLYRFTTGRLTGLTPFAYAAGALHLISDERVSANIILGDMGPEAALIAEAADRAGSDLVAASDNLAAQSVLFASSQDPLIGEELFAAGAYSKAGPSHDASLQVQDVLRWLVILLIIGGAAMKFFGFDF